MRRCFPSRVRVAAAGACLVLALACKGDGGGPAGPNPPIAGTWSGSAKAGLLQFEATFTDSGGAVGGTGRFSSPIASDDFTVQGTVSGVSVNLVLTSTELGATTFVGKFTGAHRIEGILDLGGGEKLELRLDRK